MADPPDSGVAGLLGNLFPGPNAAALYGGALSDPATQQQFNQRALAAAAGSFADSAMPTRVPTPFGAVLGHAAAAMGTSGDAVMDARLKAAQGALAGAQVGLTKSLGPAYQKLIDLAGTGGGGGAGGASVGGADAPAAAPGAIPPVAVAAATNKDVPGAPGNANTTPPPTDTPMIPFDKSKAGPGYGTEYLSQVLPAAAKLALEPFGYSMEITSGQGARPGTPNSMHPSGGAVDIKIIGPDGKIVPRDVGTPDSTGWYGKLALTARQMMDPEIAPWFAWGGGFGTPDVMHYDLGGDRGAGHTLAQMAADAAKVAKAQQAQNPNLASAAQPPAGGAGPAGPSAPGGGVGGLLDIPDLTGKMNAPIGVGGPAAAAAPAPGPAAAAGPMQTAGGPGGELGGLLSPQAAQGAAALLGRGPAAPAGPATAAAGPVRMADASGAVPPPAAPGPNLVPGGGANVAPQAPPSLVPPPPGPSGPPPVPPVAAAQPAPAPAAGPPTGPPAAPTLTLPPIPSTLPPMPGGMSTVSPTPQQQIAQGIAGISSLLGKPAPDFIQDLAKMPTQMAMEKYKAFVGAQANMMTEQYKKQIEVAAAGTISYLQSQGALPADITKLTTEQDLRLRNEMLNDHGLVRTADGKGWQFDPQWLASKGQEAAAQQNAILAREKASEQYKAGLDMIDVTINGKDMKIPRATYADMLAKNPGLIGGYTPPPGSAGAPGTGLPGAGAVPAPAPPAGGAGPAAPPPIASVGKPYFTPQQTKEQEGVGSALADEFKEVNDDATHSMAAKNYLVSIQQAMQTFDNPGAGATDRLTALKGIQGALGSIGLPVSPELQKWIANGEVMGKSGAQLGYELARTLGPRESQNIIQQAIANNPGLQTSPQGNKQLIGLMGAIIQRNQDKLDFYNNYYKNNNNSFMGANTAFNAWNPVEKMVSAVPGFEYQSQKVPKAQYDKLPYGVTFKNPDGSTWTKAEAPTGAR